MSDIVEKLRLLVPSDSSGAAFDAVNEIAALRAENERLRAALKETASDFEMSLQIDKQKDAEIERLRAALREAYEVYAGSDGFIPETASEGYQQQVIKQMVSCISAALEEKQ